eukprot:Gb_14491 [translate_table: standard]
MISIWFLGPFKGFLPSNGLLLFLGKVLWFPQDLRTMGTRSCTFVANATPSRLLFDISSSFLRGPMSSGGLFLLSTLGATGLDVGLIVDLHYLALGVASMSDGPS